jgi:hypothetical protein
MGIPSSIETRSQLCFSEWTGLSVLVFDINSHLSALDRFAFEEFIASIDLSSFIN